MDIKLSFFKVDEQFMTNTDVPLVTMGLCADKPVIS